MMGDAVRPVLAIRAFRFGTAIVGANDILKLNTIDEIAFDASSGKFLVHDAARAEVLELEPITEDVLPAIERRAKALAEILGPPLEPEPKRPLAGFMKGTFSACRSMTEWDDS
jgi:hypothetical protein